jgi:predicted NUDIX family NTP pyrophosphohydrolase
MHRVLEREGLGAARPPARYALHRDVSTVERIVGRVLAAKREFAEETGYAPSGELVSLGAGHAAGRQDRSHMGSGERLDREDSPSNSFKMESPPRSGRRQSFPELDRVAWSGLNEAHS